MTEEDYRDLCDGLDRATRHLGSVGRMRVNLDLFESGWADAHGNHRDESLWDNNYYRGGWMAAPIKREL